MHALLVSLLGLAVVSDAPIPAREAPLKMTLPEGFKATLFAGEPDIVQPIAFTFDDRGRLWVVECLSYPEWSQNGAGKDRVVILDDTDGDGEFDKKTVVWDQGANLTGIELGFGGVWLCSTPNLLFLPLASDADKPSGPPQVVLDGWDLKARHNVFNGLVWGPDGWLYGCNGILSNSKVGKPGLPDEQRVRLNCGVWRYHPTRKVFEAVAHGSTNPWGLDYDEYGELFITNCVIHHLFHIIPGAHYDRMFGQDLNPHVYRLLPSCADHIHWAGGNWTTSRGGQGAHSVAGGGHAHSGAMIYLGDNWPERYRNGLFTCNIHGNRVNHDLLVRKGSGYVAQHSPDVMLANDPWFRGLAIHHGPDGGVYVADWCDTGECHNYMTVDRSNGRIHKITHGQVKPWRGDLSKLTDEELVRQQLHANDWFARHARRLLQERAAAGRLERETPARLAVMVRDDKLPVTRRLRALWAVQGIGAFERERLLEDVAFPSWDDTLRAWVARLEMETAKPALAVLEEVAQRDASPRVQRALASGLQRLPVRERARIARPLLMQRDLAADANLPLLLWYGVEPVAEVDAPAALGLLEASKIPLVREFLTRRLATRPGVETPLPPLLEILARAQEDGQRLDLLRGLQEALIGRRSVPLPESWEKAYATVAMSPTAEVRERALALALQFDDPRADASLRATVLDARADAAVRERALGQLVFKARPEVVPLLQELLTDRVLAGPAARGLGAFSDPKTPELLLRHYGNFSADARADAIAALSSRPAYARVLLDSVEKGTLPRSDISAFAARQIDGMKNAELSARLSKVWGTVRPPTKEKAALMTKYKGNLKPDALKGADLALGKAVYVKSCAACHRLFGEGGDVGPELTGAQRGSLDYLLENVLDPSAVVAREYRITQLALKNGRVLNGIIKQETERALTLRTEKETVIVPRDEIEERQELPQSMMPEGLFDKLSKEEVRDLTAYLASPAPPLTSQKR